MRSKQQVVSEFRRGEIVKAARVVFARKGFSGGIMDEIAKEAGVAKGTVYLYFPSKREIFHAVLDEDMESLAAMTLESIDAAEGIKEKIRAFAQTRIENAEAKADLFKIMELDSGNLSFTRGQYQKWLEKPVLRLKAALEEAARKREIRKADVEQCAWAVADLTRGIIRRRLTGKAERTAAEEAHFVLEFVWLGLRRG